MAKTKPSLAAGSRTRKRPGARHTISRTDAPEIDSASLWSALSRTPGVGVSIIDVDGRLLFVNDTSMVLFFDKVPVDYQGKKLSDVHPPQFAKERLIMIRSVLEHQRPMAISHIYNGHAIHSTLWPIRDQTPPFNRVIVVSHSSLTSDDFGRIKSVESTSQPIESFETSYIDLGPLNVLTKRELEVMVLLGHGLSVPRAAAVLHRSPKTVQRHKAALTSKLHLHGQSEIVRIVTSMGLEMDQTRLKRYKK
ncbi:MAG: LuxR C-terminal-related transcriptional regulator [Pirellulaceae bacterium]